MTIPADLSNKAELSIDAVQSTYVKGQLIDAVVSLKNLTHSRLAIVYEAERWNGIWIQIKDISGKSVPYIGPITDSFRSYDTLAISPAAVIYQDISLNSDFGNDPSTRPIREFLPGTYSVWAEFGNLKSKTVKFKVTDLPSSEKEVREKVYHSLFGAGSEKGVEIGDSLIRTYPNSIYLPLIYWELFSCMDFAGATADLQSKTLEFLDRFPQLPAARHGVFYNKIALLRKLGAHKESELSARKRREYHKEIKRLKARYASNKRLLRYIDEEIK